MKWLDEKLDKSRYIPEVIYTERAGHAVEIAALKAKEEAFAVVAIGGDGTINEIARSLVHTKTALGIIPCGSGNGLARHLQIPMDAKKAINIINEGLIDIIDYGKINDVPFFCTCGVGFDAFVSLQFSKAGRRGPLIYLEKTLLESLKYKPETYELEMDGSTLRYKAFLIACGNASQYGNNAYITPQATLNDGLLDVTILEPFTVLDVPALSFQLFNKTIDQNSRIKTFRCKTLRIHRSKQGVIHFDGDPMIMGENIDVNIIKRGLQVIVPKNVEKDSSNVLQRARVVGIIVAAVNGTAYFRTSLAAFGIGVGASADVDASPCARLFFFAGHYDGFVRRAYGVDFTALLHEDVVCDVIVDGDNLHAFLYVERGTFFYDVFAAQLVGVSGSQGHVGGDGTFQYRTVFDFIAVSVAAVAVIVVVVVAAASGEDRHSGYKGQRVEFPFHCFHNSIVLVIIFNSSVCHSD